MRSISYKVGLEELTILNEVLKIKTEDSSGDFLGKFIVVRERSGDFGI